MDAMRGFLRRGTSVLFVSHNLAAVKRFCDRVILLDHGQVLSEAAPDIAIAEYSRLVSRLEEANPAGLENSQIGGRARSCSGARIEAVRILDETGRAAPAFVAGRPVRIEVDYDVNPDCSSTQLNFVVSVNMFGAGMFYQFESLRDGVAVEPRPGRGTITVDFPHLSLGEGVYQVGVAMADEKGLPQHDWHDRAYRIHVISDNVSEGPVHQPRVWNISNQTQHPTTPLLEPLPVRVST
jgi:hypothetical protein